MRWAVLTTFFYQPGGGEQFSYLVARELDAKLYVPDAGDAAFETYAGSRERTVPRPTLFRRGKLHTANRVWTTATRRDVDADALLLSGNYAFYRALADRRPSIAYLHAAPHDPYGLEGRAARRATRLVANSPAVAEAARLAYGREADAVVPPPIDLAAHDAAPPGPRFLAGGRLVPEKRFDRLVEAAAEAKAEVDVYGDGRERARLERLARDLEAPVRFLGRVDEATRRGLLSAARAFVFPSVDEPFGLAPVEALACGKTVVAGVDCGGPLGYLEDGRTAVLFEGAAGLARALAEFDDGAARRRMDACRLAAARFDAPRVAAELVAVLAEAA